jgi:hypothetical protein
MPSAHSESAGRPAGKRSQSGFADLAVADHTYHGGAQITESR